jgi:phage tail sheath protein FI
MAEVLVSPGVLARENDQSFLSAQPVQAGAAIVGPTLKGPVGIPTLVTSFSDYKNVYGCVVESGSAEYTYLTSISAYNYFQQGGDSLLVTRVVSGSYTAASSTTISSSKTANDNVLTLKTISEGVIMNSGAEGVAEGTNNTLSGGTKDNLRWEIVNPDTSKGTFSLLVRRGNDRSNDKTILETWPDLSLDPNSNNYIEKAIGNTKLTVTTDGNDTYVKNEGTYNNLSRYIYVDSVSLQTLNYFDNNGTAQTSLTSSIPIAQSGTFSDATGTAFTAFNSPANFYDSINNTNSQGFDDKALAETANGSYSKALSLLANKDDYQYNVLTLPGLILANDTATAELTTAVNNAQTRGDYIAVVDTVNCFATSLATVTEKAATIDSSYGATYWPWLQTIDPDLGSKVWVPASTLIPGVYAFNDASSETWFAPAGLNRGGLSTVLRAERKLTNGNRNTLYTANVNPIATFPNTGVVVFGQKTLQKKASALDRVNVRRLLISLKSFISQIADTLVFEQNTITTRNNFLSSVNPYLESVQQRQGLYAFKVVMDESNNTPDVIDRNQLVGQIFIQPTRTAEFIYLDFNIQPTGATFDGAGGGAGY